MQAGRDERSERKRSGWWAALACGLPSALIAGGLAACDGDDDAREEGGLVIVIESDLAIPKDIDRLELEVTQGGKSLLEVSGALGSGKLRIPAELELPFPGNEQPVQVHGVASLRGTPRIERSAVTPVPATRVGVLHLAFKYLCDGSAAADGSSSCGRRETCVLGVCASTTVLPKEITDYTPASARTPDGGRGASDGPVDGGCFDVLACFAGAQPVEVERDACVFALPDGIDAERLNVALQLPLGGDGVCDRGACYVALDQGAGFRVDGATVQLPAGVCEKMAAGRPITVVVSDACRAKRETTPLCGDWSSVDTPIESPAPPSAIGEACAGAKARSCGRCGTQARSCRNGRWSEFGACGGEGACEPDETRTCQSGGMQRCSDDCEWSACAAQDCVGEATRACGRCGVERRECDASSGRWSPWSECADEKSCMAGDTRPCGAGGTEVCSDACEWGGECGGQVCSGAASQACGHCELGTQTRTCDGSNATWSDWSACSDVGCAPGTTESCGASGARSCDDECHWGECLCAPGVLQCGATCQEIDDNHCGACGVVCDPHEMCLDERECGCFEGKCPTTLVPSVGPITRLLTDGTNLYWTRPATFSNGAYAADGAIMKVSVSGGTPVPLATGLVVPQGSAIHGGYVYWVSAPQNAGAMAGSILRVPIGGGSIETVASSLDYPWEIAIDGGSQNIYFGGGSIYQFPLAGGQGPFWIANGNFIGGLAIGGGKIYWNTFTGSSGSGPDVTTSVIRSLPIGAGAPTDVRTMIYRSTRVAADASGVYFFRQRGPSDAADFLVNLRADGTTVEWPAGTSPYDLALDDAFVYWTDGVCARINGSALAARVYRAPKAGGAAVAIAGGFQSGGTIAVDSASVYWVGSVPPQPVAPNVCSGTLSIMKLAK